MVSPWIPKRKPVADVKKHVCPVRASSGRFAGNNSNSKSFHEPTRRGFLRQHRINKKNLINTTSARPLVAGDSIATNIFHWRCVFCKSYCSFAVSGDTVEDVGWRSWEHKSYKHGCRNIVCSESSTRR